MPARSTMRISSPSSCEYSAAARSSPPFSSTPELQERRPQLRVLRVGHVIGVVVIVLKLEEHKIPEIRVKLVDPKERA